MNQRTAATVAEEPGIDRHAPAVPAGLIRLIAANSPYWAAEAEVCRTYFESPRRTARSDCTWLARQASKELVLGVIERAEQLRMLLSDGEGTTNIALLTRTTEELHEEATHYAAFAQAYEQVRPDGVPPLDAVALRHEDPLPQDVALTELRTAHRVLHGELGALARLVTEGGYCTLFSEGMRLAGNGGADDAIARACALVHDDEFEHMVRGVVSLRNAGLGAPEWDLLVELTVAQSRLRVHMRQEQFDQPVPEARLKVLLVGGAPPLPFNWERAGFVDHAA